MHEWTGSDTLAKVSGSDTDETSSGWFLSIVKALWKEPDSCSSIIRHAADGVLIYRHAGAAGKQVDRLN